MNYRRFVIIAELWLPEVARTGNFVRIFFAFFLKRTTYGKLFKILFRKFPPPHRSTLLCLNVVKFIGREIGEIVRYLPEKKNNISTACETVATARIAPKICQDQPQQYADSAPDFIQISSPSAE